MPPLRSRECAGEKVDERVDKADVPASEEILFGVVVQSSQK